MTTFADRVLVFYKQLSIQDKLPAGIGILNPYQNEKTFALCRAFYKKYFDDNNERSVILGINPGRFGAGLTGIPFTDPKKLEERCGIPNDFPKKTELSAEFIHQMMDAFGGQIPFYKKYFINSVSPLGFIQRGKNLNYYDTPALMKSIEPFILASIRQQLALGITSRTVFCLGEGANFKYLSKLNEKEKFFDRIIPLAHPRFIMQYRRKFVNEYVGDYLEKLVSV